MVALLLALACMGFVLADGAPESCHLPVAAQVSQNFTCVFAGSDCGCQKSCVPVLRAPPEAGRDITSVLAEVLWEDIVCRNIQDLVQDVRSGSNEDLDDQHEMDGNDGFCAATFEEVVALSSSSFRVESIVPEVIPQPFLSDWADAADFFNETCRSKGQLAIGPPGVGSVNARVPCTKNDKLLTELERSCGIAFTRRKHKMCVRQVVTRPYPIEPCLGNINSCILEWPVVAIEEERSCGDYVRTVLSLGPQTNSSLYAVQQQIENCRRVGGESACLEAGGAAVGAVVADFLQLAPAPSATDGLSRPTGSAAPDEGQPGSRDAGPDYGLWTFAAGAVLGAIVLAAIVSIALHMKGRRRRTWRSVDSRAAVNSSSAMTSDPGVPPPKSLADYTLEPGTHAHASGSVDGGYYRLPSFTNAQALSGIVETEAPPTVVDSTAGFGGFPHARGQSGQATAAMVPHARPEPHVPALLRVATTPTGASSTLLPLTPHTPRTSIAHTLEELHRRDVLLFGKFKFAGVVGEHQRRGGQALVQFVEEPGNGRPLAAKFFTRLADFQREHEFYKIDALRAAMPTLLHFAQAGWRPSHWGDEFTLPDCLVMERGDTLQEYLGKNKHNIFTTVEVLGHVLQKLADLHAAGWVHRDLKPGNILYISNRHEWLLLDFGLVAKVGAKAKVIFSLAYAAPEVLQAKEAGEREVRVTPAMDMWAFGMIAFEMLTESPVFTEHHSRQFLFDAILGRVPLPWEHPDIKDRLLKKLGMFKKSILSCLRRDPAKRATGQQLVDMWENLFSYQTVSARD